MSKRYLLASFDHESELLAAAAAARRQGWAILDAYTPYAVHGLDEVLGLPRSRLTWVCFACGMIGALGMLWFEHWTMAVSWPVNVGGKPWNSLPSDVPVAFEAGVLLAGFGSVLALFMVSKLYPGKRARIIAARVTDDRFAMLIDQVDNICDLSASQRFLAQYGAVEACELVETGEPA